VRFAAEPKVLLLDEPFGALDARVREELRHWLRRLHDEIHVTSVFVTTTRRGVRGGRPGRDHASRPHRAGRHATADLREPANPFVMDFLGNVNVFHGHVQRGRAVLGGLDISLPATSTRRVARGDRVRSARTSSTSSGRATAAEHRGPRRAHQPGDRS